MTERVHVYPRSSGRGYIANAVDHEHCSGFGKTYEAALRDFDIALSLRREDLKTHYVGPWRPYFPPPYLRGSAGGST